MKHFSPVRYSLFVQAAVSLSCSLFVFVFGSDKALSFIVGSIIFIIPNLYFTYYAFRHRDARMQEWIYRSFVAGHMGKLVLAILGFALVFRFIGSLDIAMLFTGYIAMIFTQWWLSQRIAALVSTNNERDDLIDK